MSKKNYLVTIKHHTTLSVEGAESMEEALVIAEERMECETPTFDDSGIKEITDSKEWDIEKRHADFNENAGDYE